jgi:hypothetical protein
MGCFYQQVCLLASQQGNYAGLSHRCTLTRELVNNGNGFVKYKSYQTNLNLISQRETIDTIFLDISNDFDTTSHEIFHSKLGKNVLIEP